jgi:RHS repeat-associated protein
MYTDDAAYDDAFTGHGGHGPSLPNFYSSPSNTLSNSAPGRSRTSELINTYYIYTFDGKLLAEYDHNGNCVRDYIYAGNRLIAEYKPQTDEYFYYMNDQINSTRIITNENGEVVFSQAYGPYGDVQKTWTSTYDPKLKFSGKEREGYSELDYFGARYYDHKSYRFNSVDPIINKDEALVNPQLWNLYAYCRNNPITYFDPNGESERDIQFMNSFFNLHITKETQEGRRSGEGFFGGVWNNIQVGAQDLGIIDGKKGSCGIQSGILKNKLSLNFIKDNEIEFNLFGAKFSHKVEDDWNFKEVGFGLHVWVEGKSSSGEFVIMDPLFNSFDATNGKLGYEWKNGHFQKREPTSKFNHVY